jgi:hypothetical protein
MKKISTGTSDSLMAADIYFRYSIENFHQEPMEKISTGTSDSLMAADI